jgi:hypothetical protein
MFHLFKAGDRTNVCTWFSKTWDEQDKQAKIKSMGKKSSNISMFFQGDERVNHSETLCDSTLALLGKGWFIYVKGFKCQLVGGGTTFTGAVYARDEFKKDNYVIKEKVIAHYKKKAMERKLPYCIEPEFEDSTLLRIFNKFRLGFVELIERSIQFEMCKNGEWDLYRDVPDVGSISAHVVSEATRRGVSDVDICIEYTKKHAGSFRESYRYKEEGVATNDNIDYDMKEIKRDFQILYDGVGEMDKIYVYDRFK